MVSLKRQKRRPEDCFEIFASGNLKVKCDKFSVIIRYVIALGAFNFRIRRRGSCGQRGRVYPDSRPGMFALLVTGSIWFGGIFFQISHLN